MLLENQEFYFGQVRFEVPIRYSSEDLSRQMVDNEPIILERSQGQRCKFGWCTDVFKTKSLGMIVLPRE